MVPVVVEGIPTVEPEKNATMAIPELGDVAHSFEKECDYSDEVKQEKSSFQ